MSHSNKQTSRAEMTMVPDAVVLAVIRYLDPDRTEIPVPWLSICGYLLALVVLYAGFVWFDHWLFSH
jgi:hypothetical protein